MTTAICPGSFDPPTKGHMDIIERAAQIFDRVVVGVAARTAKQASFSLQERLEMVKESCKGLANVEVKAFDGLLVNFARGEGAKVIVKGLRAVSDFEFELQQAMMNRSLRPDLETLFLMTSAEHSFLSSSIVKEIAQLGGSVRDLVPEPVEGMLKARFGG